MKFTFLTSLSFGVHSPRRCPYRALLSDHENKRFVIIALREPQQADGRFGKAFQHVLTKVWDKNNPFSWGDDSPAHRVVALEVDWSSIVGIDYRCPLHDDGKLVLEARHVVKRCFKTVEDARDFYSPRAPEVNSSFLRASYSAAPTPSKMSLDGRQAQLASVSCAHMGAHLPVSPRFARPFSCGPTASALGAGVLRHVSSAEVRTAAAAAIAAGLVDSTSAGGDWYFVGRGRAPGSSTRSGVEPGARSVSATRAPRPGAAAAHVCRAAGTRAMASRVPRSSQIDYVSADEGDGGSRRRRSAAGVAAGVSGGGWGAAAAEGAEGVTGGAARRRLQLRAVDSLSVSGQGDEAAAGARQTGLLFWDAPAARGGATRQPHLEASPRKAKSTNDLCGMEATQGGGQRKRAGVPTIAAAAAAAAAAAPNSGAQSVDWTASATAGGVRISAVHRCDAVNASWDCGSLPGAGCRGARGRGGAGIGCSSSVDSLSQAFMSQQHQQLVESELTTAGSRRQLGGGNRVRREVTSWTHLSDTGLDGGGTAGSGGAAGFGESRVSGGCVPRASRWTQPSATYCYNTLVLSFRDPFLPQELRRFVKSDMRLLKLYESGLPAWAVFMPCYGLPYRPWLRRALWLLFIAISVFSMGCGFYDLYKNVPFLKQVITAVASRMYLPAAELFEWLERHTQIRMSILLTYLFSKSPLLVSLMRALRSLAALLQQLLAPAAAAVSGALAPILGALQVAAASVGGGVAAAGGALWQAAQPVVAAASVSGREVAALAAAVLGPPARALWALAVLLAQLVRLVAALVGMVLVGPVQVACSIGGALSWAGAEVAEQLAVAAEATAATARWVVTLGRAARRAAPAVKAGARLAAQATGSAAGGGGLSGGMAVWHWLGLEVVGAYNAVRLTFLQAFKSAQAVMNFCVTVANTAVQHRVSLLLQLRRFITRQKERLPPAVAASVPLPAFVSMPSFSSIPAFDIPLPGPDPDVDLLEDSEREELVSAGLAAAPAQHSLYDVDMVLLGTSDEEGVVLAQETQHMYGSDGGIVVHRDGGGGGGGLSEPIPIPLGRGRSSGGGGLRRRRVHSSRLGAGGGGDRGHQRYGMYDVSRPRLDAVDEEELEDAQQLSDRDSVGAGPRSAGVGGAAAEEGDGGVYYMHGSRRLTVGPGGRRVPGRNPWTSHGRGGLEEAEAEDGDYLSYASAPGCRDAGHGGSGSGGLLADGVVPNDVGLWSSLSSPSRRHGPGLEDVPLSRSVPAATHTRGRQPPPLELEAASGHKQQQQQLLNHKQQQSRRSRRPLGRSASSPPERASTAAATGSADGAVLAPAVTAGAVAMGAARAGCTASTWGAGTAPQMIISHGARDALTCSSPFVRGCRTVSSDAAGAPSLTVSSDTSSSVVSAGVGGSGDDGARNKGRGGGTGGGANNVCGKRTGGGAKHVSRQPAIQAA